MGWRWILAVALLVSCATTEGSHQYVLDSRCPGEMRIDGVLCPLGSRACGASCLPCSYACGDHPGLTPITAGQPYYGDSTPNSGGRVYVHGYYRSNGTYVAPHTRSRPR